MSEKDFIIKDNWLEKYVGNEVDVIIPDGVEGIDIDAFSDCDLKSVVIPKSVVELYDDPFGAGKELDAIYYLGSLKDWINVDSCGLNRAKSLFIGGKKVEGELVIPKGIDYLHSYAFRNWKDITSVVIPEGVTEIGNFAFDNCSSLKSVTIPKSVSVIESDAFFDCEFLNSVVFSERMPFIYENAFYGCKNLKEITFTGSRAQFMANMQPKHIVRGGKWMIRADYFEGEKCDEGYIEYDDEFIQGVAIKTVKCTDGDIIVY